MQHRDENRQTPLKDHPLHLRDGITEDMRTGSAKHFISAQLYTTGSLKTSLMSDA